LIVCIKKGAPLMRKIWLVFSQAATVALALLFVITTLKPQWLKPHSTAPDIVEHEFPAVSRAHQDTAALAALSYRDAAKRASPAVVSITASKTPERSALESEDPWLKFFFREHGMAPNQRQQKKGLGSGVIVSSDGYLLTNNHVITGADDIEVRLFDGRQVQAKLVGTDPETDVAVLKIALDKLPAIQLGNMDELQVGDVVLAIGNPFGVGQTVTSGIVSALGRNHLGINTFENFIQTDAAINPGNSGGALVDTTGNLIGINTAIYSRSGGNMGIGFAIPVSTAKQVMDSLIQGGQVVRGWIGVEPQDLTAEIAASFGLPIKQGVLITGVLQNGPAHKAGLRIGDVVIKIGETTVTNTSQLLTAVAAIKPQASTTMAIQRSKKTIELNVTVSQRPKSFGREAFSRELD
jgi:serine protease DegQ